jgi:hypothetical protein
MFKNSRLENLVITQTFARKARLLRRGSDGLILAGVLTHSGSVVHRQVASATIE